MRPFKDTKIIKNIVFLSLSALNPKWDPNNLKMLGFAKLPKQDKALKIYTIKYPGLFHTGVSIQPFR